jgi:hypothetical protein
MVINATTAANGERIGTLTRSNTSASAGTHYLSIIACTSTSTSVVYVSSIETNGSSPLIPQNGNASVGSTELQYFEFLVPIVGWN